MFSGWGPSPMSYTGDCVLRTADGGAFPVHRAYMSTASPYFRGLLEQGDSDVLVSGIKAPVLHVLLTHEYTDRLYVTFQNVLEVMAAADMLLLDKCKEKCLQMLVQNIHIDNCLGIAAVTKKHSPYKERVMEYVHEKFDEIWRASEELRETPAVLLCELLNSPELCVRKEQDVLHAIARWCNATSEEPEVHRPGLQQLLQCVRVGICKSADLTNFRRFCPALAESSAYRKAVLRALKRGPLHVLAYPQQASEGLDEAADTMDDNAPPADVPGNVANVAAAGLQNDLGAANADADDVLGAGADVDADAIEDMEVDHDGAGVADDTAADMPVVNPPCKQCGKENPERWLPRLPHCMLFVVGGWSNGVPLSSTQVFDPLVNSWVSHEDPSAFGPRAHHAVTVHKRRVFVVGGMRQQECLRSAMSYDMDSLEWKTEASMHVQRAYVSAVTLGDYIYAIGGHTGRERTPSVERYCTRTGEWVFVHRMHRRRSDAAACTFNGRAYVCGGFNGERCLDSVEEYTPETDTWSFMHSLPFARSSHRMIKMGAYVYVLGGFDGRRRLTAVVRSLAEPPLKWRSVSHMRKARSAFGVAQLDDELYVIGGFNGKTVVANVERYSAAEKKWMTAPPLSVPASAMAACVVSGAAIAKKFSVRDALTVKLKLLTADYEVLAEGAPREDTDDILWTELAEKANVQAFRLEDCATQ
ncbi:hypothetical protein HPB50_006665 [Hyalomma asiaticum]|uniref:Uncharacterized protein n=1 Tax=Hyalomma asiaticum TaxID=266040 RepID=A0ACB7SSG7_HYAAI|nr:hypothetical protein HPB50_006665 [Hyalomma asiaticum]